MSHIPQTDLIANVDEIYDKYKKHVTGEFKGDLIKMAIIEAFTATELDGEPLYENLIHHPELIDKAIDKKDRRDNPVVDSEDLKDIIKLWLKKWKKKQIQIREEREEREKVASR